jgi:hypothetical protein
MRRVLSSNSGFHRQPLQPDPPARVPFWVTRTIAYSSLLHGPIEILPNKTGKVAAGLNLDGDW